MTTDLAMLWIVQSALWLFYALVPWLALKPWLAREAWSTQVGVAVLAGTTSQAILGFLWGLWIRQPARWEGMIYLGLWLVMALVVRRGNYAAMNRAGEKMTPVETGLFIGLLLLGMVIRLIHPLRTWALGQSDAYSHLAMFRDVVEQGALGNVAYPPGYAWILSMPMAVFHVDPYFAARFGGAFLGVALLLAVFALLSDGCRDRQAGMAGVLLVAAFPGLALLQKTGVGAFANQAGLFFLPMIFWGVLLAFQKGRRAMGVAVLMSSLAGLLATVPMMLMHVGLALILFWLCMGRKVCASAWPWIRRFTWAGIALLVVGLTLVVQVASHRLAVTAVMLTTADETVAAHVKPGAMDGLTALGWLARDFVSLKHVGMGNGWVNGVLAILFGLFVALILVGMKNRKLGWGLVGIWGGLAAAQTATGLLQFTAYQREGWSLLLAMGCLGGLVVSWLWAAWPRWRWGIVLGMILFAGISLWRPPTHVLTTSTAEETLVRMARMLQSYPNLSPNEDAAVEHLRRFILANADVGRTLAVMNRPVLQELMLPSVCGANEHLRFSDQHIWRTHAEWMSSFSQVLVLLDKFNEHDPVRSGITGDAQNFAEKERRSYEVNSLFESHIQQLPTNEWRTVRCEVTPGLRAMLVSRKPDGAVSP